MHFVNRRDAGQQLAQKLSKYRSSAAVVYALPRGGVETAVEVAKELKIPLDLVITRKIGHIADPEYAVCAVTETGPLLCDDTERTNLDTIWLKAEEAKERTEAKRRRKVYLAGRKPISAKAKIAILVDDGIATGLTMRAAVEAIKQQKPAKIVVAVPVAPNDIVYEFHKLVDEMVVLTGLSDFFGAISVSYDHFPQLSDEEVIGLLKETEK